MMNGHFIDVTETLGSRFAECPLAKQLPDADAGVEIAVDTDRPIMQSPFIPRVYGPDTVLGPSNVPDVVLHPDVRNRLPQNNGVWTGEKGNSVFHPDLDHIPQEMSPISSRPYSNPEGLSWRDILDKYGIDGIEFRNGFPVFDTIARGSVEIDGFETGGSDAKERNFKRADIEMAKQRGCSPEEVRQWRKENGYTWHECEDKRTMQKVPHEVHANIPHDGGRSQH